jgi:hypothetical protein
MVQDREAGKQVCKAVDRVEGTPIGKGGEGRVEGMGRWTSVSKEVRMAEGTPVDKKEGHMGEDTPFCMVEDTRVGKMEEDIPFYMGEDTLVCKVRKWEGMVRNSHYYNGWNSLSTRVPRHPKKATRLMFPVVFSLKDSLC